ncbi:hypothetical protein [Streptomyces sp. NPDC005538]
MNGSSFATVEGNTGNPDTGGANEDAHSKTRETNSGYDVMLVRVR